MQSAIVGIQYTLVLSDPWPQRCQCSFQDRIRLQILGLNLNLSGAMASSGAPMLSWICSGVRVSPMLLRYSWRFTVKQRHADYAASASSQTRPHNLQLGYPPCLCESHPLLVWSFKKLIVLPTEQDQQEVPGGQGRSSQASDVASCPLLRRAPPVGSNIARCFNPKKDAHFMNLYHAL